MARNGGKLKSDDPLDPVKDGALDEKGAANAPEVDHIVPKSKGGSNYFSNARLISWQLNNREDRVKSLKGLSGVPLDGPILARLRTAIGAELDGLVAKGVLTKDKDGVYQDV